MPLNVIEKTRDYVVAVKPYGVLSEWDAARANMIGLLADELSLPRESIYPVHRLDATTVGLIVYALTKNAAAELSRLIADGGFGKEYLALITAADDLPASGEMRDMLFFDRRQAKSFVVTGEKRGAKEAVLEYSLGESFDYRGTAVTAAHIRLKTGRTHQIRAQFSSRRSPLLGDGKYGSRVNFKKPALFSCAISFEWRGRGVSYSLGEPDEYIQM